MRYISKKLAALFLPALILGGCENHFFNQILGEKTSSGVYTITVTAAPAEGGTLLPSRTEAAADTAVTVVVFPNPGYRTGEGLRVDMEKGGAVPVSGSGFAYSFT
ncbi:MAG: hypothetical protein LBE14_02155, partial [Treponema sp.]|nr:hypothetical protein [Treponema sp.]